MKDLEGKISEDEKNRVTEKVDSLKAVLNSENVDEIKTKNDELTQEFYKISEKLYQNVNQNPESEKNESDVVDAEYEVVDEDEDK